jgi:ferredoxin
MPKPRIDLGRCQGHGRCALLAPGVFDVDDGGHSVLLVSEIPADKVADVEEAVSTCPEQALSLAW